MEDQLILFSHLRAIEDIWKFKLETLEDRIRLQKLVYLMQAVGCNVNYDFNLYIRGPYSPELTRDAFALSGLPNETKETIMNLVTLSPEEQTKLKNLRSLISGMDNILDLEILSTLYYLQHEAFISGKNDQKVKDELIRRKPYAQELPIEKYWERLKQFNLI